MTLDLIEQVASLRGALRAVEAEWDDMRSQIRKGYQRMEKAHERLATEETPKVDVPTEVGDGTFTPQAQGFAEKYARLKTG